MGYINYGDETGTRQISTTDDPKYVHIQLGGQQVGHCDIMIHIDVWRSINDDVERLMRHQ